MRHDPEKTIPYTQSPAELENLRLLRKTARFFSDLEGAKAEPEPPQETDGGNSELKSGASTSEIHSRS